MNKFILLLLTTVLMFSCNNKSGSHGNAKKTTLKVAVEANYVPYFEKLASDFSKNKDIRIEVIPAEMLPLLDSLEIQKGNSADIFMLTNDRIGGLSEKKLISPINVSLEGYTENAIKSGTYNQKIYFLPMSTDTTLLIYNKDKVSTLPTFLSQLDPSDWAAKFTDFYYTAGMFQTTGAIILDDQDQLSINNKEAIAASMLIQKLYNSGADHWALMKDDTLAYNVMTNAFINQDISYLINGPWALADIMKAGIDVGVMPIPSWDGSHPYQALTGTKGLGINAYSNHIEVAEEFIQFLAGQENAQLWYEMTEEVAPHTGVIYPAGSHQEVAFLATSNGLAMPNIPSFEKVWVPMQTALIQIANSQDVKASLDAAQERIEREISDL
ncbi:extracellular solute-binding protein [Entomospira entomophila]|uniref:Extracellular solute-binding protein n=1 Tax=Entomospira entomophila TaxID=2719988 RepID=A0A968KTJ7_9SPIO|nr:extracellular solute-binding protein [Entomospira entomophilus]NIZ40396.1 extracellular solute-binding protein [Entomospira entomophilus]WDI35955.1 extracellular solute-binding protein [Entomospira entomophilus]